MNKENLSFKAFKTEALKNEQVKKEYELLKPIFELKKELIKARKEAGLTQDDLARKLNTKRNNISRLESFSYKSFPRLSTILNYAKALGYKIEIKLIKE